MTTVAPPLRPVPAAERWTPPALMGPRLDKLFEETCDRIGAHRPLAVEACGASVTYGELDGRANQLARYLRLRGAGPGDRIALLFDHPVAAHIGMLAVLKAGAAFLPLEGASVERAAAIVVDAGALLVLTQAHRYGKATRIASLADSVEPVVVDDAARLIGQLSTARLVPSERRSPTEPVACLLYPAERARGVAIDHATLCAAVRLAVQVYGIGPGDRVFQGGGLTTGFAIEGTWMTWVAGATLVGGPPDLPQLHRFLSEQRVTAMCGPPALLAGLADDLPDLRFLLVAGEPCPQELVTRLAAPGRRLFTASGPVEAVGTVNRAELRPFPLGIGAPSAAERTVILDRDDLAARRAAVAPRPTPRPRTAPRPTPFPRSTPRPSPFPRSLSPRPSPSPRPTPAPAPAATALALAPPRTTGALETAFAAVLAEVLQREEVPTDSHFFTDLGADSLVMARFCARLRKRDDLPKVSIKDVYRHSTIRRLAEAFAAPSAAPSPALLLAPARPVAPTSASSQPGPPSMPVSRSKPRYVLCGTLQLLAFLAATYALALGAFSGLDWIFAGAGLGETYLRAVIVGGGGFVALGVLPILAKWTLIGRWKPRQIPIWSVAYLRFWVVKTLLRTSPLVRFAGTPLYLVYLRALGAKIGKGVTILSTTVPVGTDLLTIGSGTVIRKDATFACYRAHDGMIQIGSVTLGRDAYVGEATVLDIGTGLGDGAQLGHTSSLHPGQLVPAGERWHGSPAARTQVDYRVVPSGGRFRLRRIVLSVLQLGALLAVVLPIAAGGLEVVATGVPQLAAVAGSPALSLTSGTFYADALVLATALYFGSLLLGLVVVGTVPRVLRLLLTPGRDYRLYGVRYGAHRAIGRLTNRKIYTRLFGDSSFIVAYLRSLGYDLFRVEQTGSNFGTDVRQDSPFLSAVGSGTVIADGLSIVNADYSNTHFRVSRVRIGARNFLGNRIAYPAQGRTGANCLLATKVMVPIDGPVREGVGLLGSPSFEIPRTVERDNRLDVQDRHELRRLLSAKNRHNAVTIAAFLLTRWLLSAALTVLGLVTLDLYPTVGAPVAALAGVLVLPLTGDYLLIDRMARPLAAHRPDGCSIYDRAFWRHERFWKLCADAYLQIFNGTPFKNLVWRMLGVRIGRRVFDDGCFITERAFTTIGDGATLAAGSVIQCHSQEDGAFKSDRTAIGAGTTLGVNAFVHYGVTIGDGATLAPDSFLMKGGQVPSNSRWGGNPATEL